MSANEHDLLLATLRARFEKNLRRHPDLVWPEVEARISASPRALAALSAMEASGGEPDVIGRDGADGIIFCDCSPETPQERRSICYDRAALDARKENKPRGCAEEMVAGMGITLLTEEQYRALQQLGEFDRKTSSWIATPPDVRALGGALFCDRRYGRVFTYHNGAESYYAARGFRGLLTV
ncbi:MAG: DUF4256 domain-containing protein [Lysobacteraceae bacterium]|nr:MAG: DUF4256 domain-containing protein [Xanthomonadaceae bacterium]